MPLPRRRLNLALCPADPDAPLATEAIDQLMKTWVAEGVLTPEHRAGARAELVIEGGFATVRVDDRGDTSLFSNHQGGFSVRCPSCGEVCTGPFSAAITAWRTTRRRQLRCPGCQNLGALETYEMRPAGAFARWGIVFTDVGSPGLRELQAVEAALGPVIEVLTRLG